MKGTGAPRWRNRIADAWDQMETRRREGRNGNSDITEDGSDLLPFGDVYRNDMVRTAAKERPIVDGLKRHQVTIMLAVVALIGTGVFVIGDHMQRNPVRETAKPAKKAADTTHDWTVPSVSRDPEHPMPTDEEMQLLEAMRQAREDAQPPRGAEAFFTNGR